MIIPKYGIGVVSKNTVDACIDYVNLHNQGLILIPTRRQVDYFGGYVNNWTTGTLADYIRSKTSNIILERDHGGPGQGQEIDDGRASLEHDCRFCDLIHIDPWKVVRNFRRGCVLTKRLIQFCYDKNSHIKFEVGTEQSIFKYEAESLDFLLRFLKNKLSADQFDAIRFVVIQSGTSLKENLNTGNYDAKRLADMIEVCAKYGFWSKEHNGDYLSVELIKEKFKIGLDSINIAPEFGQLETQTYLDEIKNPELFDIYFRICYDSKKWVKWVDKSFDPFTNKEKLINICGHYVLSTPSFLTQVKQNVRADIDLVVKQRLTKRLEELYS